VFIIVITVVVVMVIVLAALPPVDLFIFLFRCHQDPDEGHSLSRPRFCCRS